MNVPLFVYGTLKQGFSGHLHVCAAADEPVPARCPGSLFLHPDGYPVLMVESAAVLALGTGNACHDAMTAARAGANVRRPTSAELAAAIARPPTADGGSGGVAGELMNIPPDSPRLRDIDAYEAFRPGAPSLFVRVLVRVSAANAPADRCAWTYAAGALMADVPLEPLRGGTWP